MRIWICIVFLLMSCTIQRSILHNSNRNSMSTNKSYQKSSYLQTQNVKISKPHLTVDSLVFQKNATVTIDFDQQICKTMYSINGGPTQEYNRAIQISENATVMAWNTNNINISSDTVGLSIMHKSPKFESYTLGLSPDPSQTYYGKGPNTLMDNLRGTMDFRQDKAWLGFQDTIVTVTLEFDNPTRVNEVYLSLLNNQDSWIFLPQSVKVWSQGKMIGSKSIPNTNQATQNKSHIIHFPIPKRNYSKIQIEIKSLDEIPSWHVGSGTIPWLFMDEIFIY